MMTNPNKEQQIQELDDWINSNPDARELKRALAVKLALQDWRYDAIASALNVSKSFVSKWKKRFREAGIKGLTLSYQGRKSYLSPQQKATTIAWLHQQEYWDLSELECYLVQEYDVSFQSLTSYYDLMAEARITWQKAQKKNPRQDSEVVKKRNEEIQSYLSQRKAEIESGQVVVYAIDEVHLLEGDLIHHGWGKSKERFKIPLENEKNRQTYYGALNLTNSDLILQAYPRGNGESTISFLKELMKLHPQQKIQIFWDGAPYHRSQEMRDFLESINQGLTPDNWRITCHRLAPYAPEENPIEAVWLSLKNLLRRCYRFCKKFKLMTRLFEALAKWKLWDFPPIEKYDAFSCLI